MMAIPKCRECVDRQRLVGGGNIEHRCYNSAGGYELKKTIYTYKLGKPDNLPKTSPRWCPERKH